MNHLTRGLRLLGERWTAGPRRWVKAGERWSDKAIRVGMLGVGVYIGWRIVSSSWLLLGIVVAVVCLLALRAATRDVLGEKAAPAPAEKPQQTAVDGLPAVPAEAFLALLHDVLGAASGVHLRTLAAALTARVGGAWEVADVRALCRATGVPVRPTVRAPGGGPTVGVHRDDVPPLPRLLPTVPVGPDVADYTAGQSTATSPTTGPATPTPTTTTPTVTEHDGGLRVVARDDPENPRRTHIRVIDPRRRKRP